MTDMTAIQTSSEVVDRWLADGAWVEFDGGVYEARLGSPDPKGQRLAVQVPWCWPNPAGIRWLAGAGDHPTGRITVAWATVEWGPALVGWDDIIGLHIDLSGVHRVLPEPPDVDPQTLIGQFARGGSIEVAS